MTRNAFAARTRYRSRNLKKLREERPRLAARLGRRANELLEDFESHRINPSLEHLLEHLGPDFFPNIVLDAQHKRMVRGYNEVPTAFDRIVNRRTITDFKLQRAIAAGGFVDLAEVLEGGEYKLITMPDESRGSYAVVKHGNLFGLNLEAQANDELNAFGERVSKWGSAAARTRDKFVMTTHLDSNPVIYDGKELIGSDHNNWIGTGALSDVTLKAGIQLFKTQKGIPQPDGTDVEEIQLTPRVLFVHPDEEFLARQILESAVLIGHGAATTDTVGSRNTLQGMLELVVTVRITSGRYYIAANPAEVDMFELGQYQGQTEPELFAEDMNSASAFERDVMRWKARDIFGGAWRDWRGIVGGGFADPH